MQRNEAIELILSGNAKHVPALYDDLLDAAAGIFKRKIVVNGVYIVRVRGGTSFFISSDFENPESIILRGDIVSGEFFDTDFKSDDARGSAELAAKLLLADSSLIIESIRNVEVEWTLDQADIFGMLFNNRIYYAVSKNKEVVLMNDDEPPAFGYPLPPQEMIEIAHEFAQVLEEEKL